MAHWKELFEQKYLNGADLYNDSAESYGEITATIERVTEKNVVSEGGKTSKCPIAYIAGYKPFVLNKTNCKTLAKLYGVDTKGWAKKKITIWFNPNVTFGGEKTGGLRIRNVVPKDADPCADCGQVIAPAFKKTAVQLADYSVKHYGRPLCGECIKKLIEAAKAKEEADGTDK